MSSHDSDSGYFTILTSKYRKLVVAVFQMLGAAKAIQHPAVRMLWKNLRSWLPGALIIVLLYYSGLLINIISFTQTALLKTGIADASIASSVAGTTKETLDYNFSISSLDGNQIPFSTFKDKTIFLNIWATWCGPCRAEMPAIQKLYDDTPKDVVFVMLSVDPQEQPQKVSSYVKSKGFTFPVYIATGLPEQINVKSIPATFVIAPDGTIAYRNTGMANYNTKKFKSFLGGLKSK